MKKFICFFGSNFRQLYVEDIYRCTCLPQNFVIQYRYQLKYIDRNLLVDKESLIGREGIVFYNYNPKNPQYLGTIQDCDEELILPIRKVEIRDIQINEEIGHVNFYLELKEFVEVDINKNSFETPRGNETFVHELKFKHVTNVSWLEKIEEIKEYFKNVKFFNIRSITGDNESKIIYDPSEKRTSIMLWDDSTYILDVLTYDKTEGNAEIKLCYDQSYIGVNDSLENGTKLNSKKLPLDIRPINFKKDSTYLSFRDTSSKFSIKLSIKMKKKRIRSVLFGFFSSIILLGFQLSNLLIKSNLNLENGLLLTTIASGVGIAIGMLHRLFNKM